MYAFTIHLQKAQDAKQNKHACQTLSHTNSECTKTHKHIHKFTDT